ncbi:MAG: NUDIX hydrolase [Anaerolineaceae bacterium]|nr:NUDIX hydrolase [Anaerolineaceae bacterium]
MDTSSHWLKWAQQLQALAQNGLAYCQNPFDIERFQSIRDIAAEIVATHSKASYTDIKDLFDSEAGYATPKIDVRGVVFRNNKVLLVKELVDGGWTFPGGWVDVNESPSESVEREVLEESGYQVRASKLLALYDRNKHGHPAYIFHIYKLFFLCELLGGEGKTSLETGGAQFFNREDLPPLSTARTTQEEINRFFEHLQHPEWPTDFD